MPGRMCQDWWIWSLMPDSRQTCVESGLWALGTGVILYLVLVLVPELVPVHGTLPTTPPRVHPPTASQCHARRQCGTADKRVLWAQYGPCVTLKPVHIDLLARLSGFWLSFEYRVARTICIQRPQGTYVYPFHLCVYQEWYPYPNEM